MTVPAELAGALTRHEKQVLLRRFLAERISRTRTAPASFAQERLWLLDRVHGAGGAYNLRVALRLPGVLDVPALERAVGELVRRHEALRTVFTESDGAPVQVISPFAGFTLPVEDLPRTDEAAVRRAAEDEASRPFDLTTGPLFRGRLLRGAADGPVLLLCMHHIVSDGWSLGVLTRELGALYSAFREGRPSPLTEPALQYADYAARQRERLRGPVVEKLLNHWRDRLADAPALLELPTDRPRPAAQSYRGDVHLLQLDRDGLDRVEALARSEGATLHMALLAAFQVLLGAYAGSEDVVVGTPVAGRDRRELESLVGFFVNTMALRTDLSGDPSFREVVRRVRASALSAYANQELPFDRLVAELRPERSLRHAPVVQVMFSLEAPLASGDDLPGMETVLLGTEEGTSKFDLTLALEAHEDGLSGGLEYATDLFDPETIARMAVHFQRVLDYAGRDPDLPLSALQLADEAERRQVVEGWNGTAAPYPAEQGIPALVEEWATRTPDAPALVFAGATVTCAELDARANRLAHHLLRAGVRPESRVGICLERGAELVVALLAVLKAGGAYVPLEPSYPAERLAFMLSDSAVDVVVTEEALRGSLPPGTAARIVSVDGDAAAIAAAPGDAPRVETGPRSLAHVIYTSGSTGTPKGVAIEHRGVVRLVRGTDYVRFTPADRVGQASTVAFDAATFEVWGALLNGAALVGIPRDVALSPDRLAEALRADGVTILLLTTSLFNQVARERPAAFRPLHTALFGGEAADPGAVRAVRDACDGIRLVNAYGPTENTTVSTAHVADGIAADAVSVPIGRPIANSTAYVLGAGWMPLPVGLPGELCVGGDGVARGYLGRPALTAERFVPDPFSAQPGARLYRTGDRARWRADGTLEYLGRLDGQVKLRGFRIETGEIETALRRHPGVAECAVLVREDAPGARRLVAYVAGVEDADALRAHLRRSLPEYMVPGAFVLLERMPLTPNGKLDRRALPVPEVTAGEHIAPRTPVEEVLAGIWAEVLRLDRVGADANFFALGGHSLLATRVVSRVRAAFGVEPTLRALFEAPTLAELARVVEGMRGGEAYAPPPILPAPRTAPLPLSLAQERLWLADRLRPDSAVYNVPATVRLHGALDVDALSRALDEIVRRHESLRTTFAERDGVRVQVVAPAAAVPLPVEDLSALPVEAREEAVRRRAVEVAGQSFDLEAGPLLRLLLLRLGEAEHVLFVCMHHVVTDGWSMGILFRELAEIYGAFREGRPSPLPELAIQYPDFAVWQRAHLRADAMAGHLAYWRERMAGAPAMLELPTDHPRKAERTNLGGGVPIHLPPELTARLEALGRAEGASLYMVLLAGFQLLLGRYAGSEDVVVGSPVAGRTRSETEGLIGFFVNTVVLRTELGGDPSFRALLGRVRAGTLEAYDHQDLPFETLVSELRPERSPGCSPVFQVMVALQNADASGGELAGLRSEPVETEVRTAMFDLSLMLAPAGDGGVGGTLMYASDLWERETIVRLAGHFARVLEQVAADADRPLSTLQLLDAEERRRLEAWSGADAPYPADACLHGLFEAQVARTPDAPALLHDGQILTYAALNARANRIAHHLRGLGIGPETRVGICLGRSVDLVAGILGILKAGGAYVPLDPAWPAERLAFMLEDSGAGVLVTEAATAGVLPALPGLQVVRMDADAAAIAAEPADDPVSGTGPGNLAYLIYTSGSTGRPKGVAIEHESAAALMAWGWGTYGAEELDGVLASTSVCFDMSVFEIFTPLTRGGRVVLVENALALPSSPHAGEVRLVDTVSSAMRALVATDGLPAGVRTVNLGGEFVAQDLVESLYARGVERVYDLYGPSEDTTFSTVALRRPGATPSIGTAIPNSRAWVVDAGLRMVPAGVAGEACLAGKGLARGYLGNPALTAERFVPDPFSAEPGGRMYRTGDRVRWRMDGALEYQGRMDHQVKIRGFRVEPGEVETLLRRHPGVADCAIVARVEESGDRRLVAYVVGAAPDDALRAHLRERLPEYMVPAVFVRLPALPLTPSGKVDRRSLPTPDFSAAEARGPETLTPVEEVLAAIWADVLGVERVGRNDNFFHLGGHSLLATVALARIQPALDVVLPLSALFTAPTVAELAARVESIRRAGLPALPPVVPVERGDALPLSFSQERLWFLDRLQPDSAFYNVPVALRLGGVVDAGALERALGEVVRRHEVLRTRFEDRDGTPVLVISPPSSFHLPVEDLTGADEAVVARRVAEEAARPFDLVAGLLFRARLLRLGGDEHVLLLSLHHVASDEPSLGILFRDLSAAYAAALEGRVPEWTPLPVQYADFAVWQRAQLQGESLDRQLAWWRERLTGAPALLELPLDHPRPAVQSHRGAHEPFVLSADLRGRLEALGRSEGATLFMVLLGVLQVLLSKYSGSEDVVVGSPITGRSRHEVEGLIGFFTNTLVLRTELGGDPSFREVLRRVREATLGAYDHQDVPFERLVEELQPERSLAHSPLFQVMLIQANVDGSALDLPGVELRHFSGGTETSKFDLSLAVTSHAKGLDCSMEYGTDLFERETVLRMIGHLERVMEQVVADPELRLSELELLGDDERRLVLEAWNGTDAPYPADACVHHLFEAQVERTPDALAVVHGGEALTYRALNERANRLAHRLVALGVGPETRVGISLERGPAMVVSVLAALKAGGAYVPLDPGYPSQRLAYMVADSAVPVLLTQTSLRQVLPAVEGVRILCVDVEDSEDADGGQRTGNPGVGVDPWNLAFVLYTSGSTGTPKGVTMPHAALVNLVAWNLADQPEPRTTLQFSSLSFDVSFQEIATTLAGGGTLVLVDDALRRDPEELLRYMAGHGVERLYLPFVALQALGEAAAASAG